MKDKKGFFQRWFDRTIIPAYVVATLWTTSQAISAYKTLTTPKQQTQTANVKYEPQHYTEPQTQETENRKRETQNIEKHPRKVEDLEKRVLKNSDITTEEDVLSGKLLFGEARNCSKKEKIAVLYTAINRANDNKKWNGETLQEAILKPWQYSCFNKNDPNKKKLENPGKYDAKAWQECLTTAKEVLDGKYTDPTNGATHYHIKNIMPKWANSEKMEKRKLSFPTKHLFYEEN